VLGVNGVVAFRADHERLAPAFRHAPCPFRLSRSGPAKVGELPDLVN